MVTMNGSMLRFVPFALALALVNPGLRHDQWVGVAFRALCFQCALSIFAVPRCGRQGLQVELRLLYKSSAQPLGNTQLRMQGDLINSLVRQGNGMSDFVAL